MSDFLQHMALLSIESRIAASGRIAAHAVESAARSAATAQAESRRQMQNGIAVIQTDMLAGFDAVTDQMRSMSSDLGKGMRQLDFGLIENQRAIEALGASMTVISDNLVVGFGEVLDRLDTISGTLGRIERGVTNPEETRARERYRVARKLAQVGRPNEALRHI